MTNDNTAISQILDSSIPCGKKEDPRKARFVKKDGRDLL